MTRVAFLRGMNVGGHRITNDELVAVFERMGFADVQCYAASGNVLFRGEPDGDFIERELEKALGYAVPTFLRTRDELAEVVAHNPFPGVPGKLQVTFLGQAPGAEAVRAVEALATPADRLQVRGREWYWLPEGRTTDSVLDLKAIRKHVGDGTQRTAGMVARILKKMG